MLTRGWMEIDLGALLRNAVTLQNRAGVPLIPMIKADAYGLGAVRVARALEALDPYAYGIATVDEGVELREAGITRRVIIFTPLLENDMTAAHAADLTPTLGTADSIVAWSRFGSDYELSIDTGMGRAGLPWREIRSVVEAANAFPPAAAFTHFHSANLANGTMAEQEERFRNALAQLPARPPVVHTDSSAAIVRHGRSEWDAVRPGIFLYGVGSGSGVDPECVVYVRAPIVEMRWAEPGDTVSYEATWTASSRRCIATVPLGYADGYPRNASGSGVGVVRGSSVPIAGRVTMDMIMLDVTDTGAEVGDVVTLLGDPVANNAPIDIAAVAERAEMSPYEVLTGFRGRLERVYNE